MNKYIAALLAVFLCTLSHANSVTLKWEHPTTSFDVTTEYRVYEKTPQGWALKATIENRGESISFKELSPNVMELESRLSDLLPGSHTFAVTAYNGNESERSNEAEITLPPEAIRNLRVIVTVTVELQ